MARLYKLIALLLFPFVAFGVDADNSSGASFLLRENNTLAWYDFSGATASGNVSVRVKLDIPNSPGLLVATEPAKFAMVELEIYEANENGGATLAVYGWLPVSVFKVSLKRVSIDIPDLRQCESLYFSEEAPGRFPGPLPLRVTFRPSGEWETKVIDVSRRSDPYPTKTSDTMHENYTQWSASIEGEFADYTLPPSSSNAWMNYATVTRGTFRIHYVTHP